MNRIVYSRQLTALGFRHGFSLRSSSEFTSPPENARLAYGDELQAGYRAMAEALGFLPGELFEVDQVHDAAVKVVRPGESVADCRREKVDALVACHPPVAIGIRVADCLALLLADADSGAVAAVHAGWRGLVARVVPAAIEALRSQANARPARIFGAICPHIRPCCFEVGDDVAQQLARASADPNALTIRSGRYYVDLAAIVRGQLRECGVAAARIDDLGGCTRCRPERFFSYRREGPGCGRHLAVIKARG
jgi:YfiH family protein